MMARATMSCLRIKWYPLALALAAAALGCGGCAKPPALPEKGMTQPKNAGGATSPSEESPVTSEQSGLAAAGNAGDTATERNAVDDPPAYTPKSKRVGTTDLRVNPPPAITDHSPRFGWPSFRGNPLATGVATCDLPPPNELEILWSHRVRNGEFQGTPCLTTLNERATLVIGDMDGLVLAFDLEHGRLLWDFEIKLGYACSVAHHGGRFFVGNIDGKFLCLSEAGELLWEFQAGSQIDGSATFHEDLVLFTSQDANLYALRQASGELVWTVAGGDQLRCAPVVHQEQVFLAGCDAILHGIRLADQSSTMEIPIDSPTGCTPGALGSMIYFGTMQAGFKAVDIEKKELVWTFDAGGQSLEFPGNAAVAPEIVVTGEKGRRVWGLNPQTGDVIWEQTVRSSVETGPVIVGDVVYVASNDGRLWAFRKLTGEVLLEREFRGRFKSSPAVGYGRLVLASDDGTIYCLGPAK